MFVVSSLKSSISNIFAIGKVYYTRDRKRHSSELGPGVTEPWASHKSVVGS